MDKGKFSIIIPAHKIFTRKDGKTEIEATIDSVLDQDYKNYEIIVCANGPERQKITDLISKYKVKVVETEEANAAIARNAGAGEATGEFYSFLSSDTCLKPGGLQIWKDAFDKYPEASIIYSDIDYMENGEYKGHRGHVAEYDRYEHECHNLIDGAMPCRSKYFEPWYPEVKALQDWAWSLAVTKHAPAQKIPDVCYMGELPKAGGLSDYFSKNWIALNQQIRKIHGIKPRKIVVTSVGAPFHALRTAKYMDADFLPPQLLFNNEHDYDVIYLLGYYLSNQSAHNAIFAKAKKECIRVIHWIGTDVAQMMGTSWEHNHNAVTALNEYMDLQLSEYNVTQEILTEMKLKVSKLPLPQDVDKYKVIKEKPKKFTVAVYVPGYEEMHYIKYNVQLMLDLVKAMPDINFLFFGKKPDAPIGLKNLEVLPWVPIEDVAKKANVLLRFTMFDGLPIGPIEFQMMGRDTITTAPLFGTLWVGSGRVSGRTASRRKSELIDVIRKCQKKPKTQKEIRECRAHWKKELHPDVFKAKFAKLIAQRKRAVNKKLKAFRDYEAKQKANKNEKA